MNIPARVKTQAPGDFTADTRMLLLAAMALVVGTGGVAGAWVLLRLITLCTNLAYFHVLSLTPHDLIHAKLGPASVLIPVCGALIVGLMARYGSEKIRGHGIPEALEAILIGRSRMSPKVAVLKPLSSAIAIGTGGPFGAEGPIIMTGGAIGSLFAQLFHLTAAERKDAAGRGRRRRHDRGVRHPDRRRAAGGRTAAVRVEAAQLHPRGGRLRHRDDRAQRYPARRTRCFPTPAAPRCCRTSSPPGWRSACWAALPPASSPPWSTASRMASPACRCTGCGGRPSAAWPSASAA